MIPIDLFVFFICHQSYNTLDGKTTNHETTTRRGKILQTTKEDDEANEIPTRNATINDDNFVRFGNDYEASAQIETITHQYRTANELDPFETATTSVEIDTEEGTGDETPHKIEASNDEVPIEESSSDENPEQTKQLHDNGVVVLCTFPKF